MREAFLILTAACILCLAGKLGERLMDRHKLEVLGPSSQPDCGQPVERNPATRTTGYRLVVTLPKPSFTTGESIPFKLEFRNVSGPEVTIWECVFWANHLIEVKDVSGKEVPLTDEGRQFRESFAPAGSRRKNLEIKLNSGQLYECGTATADLSRLFRLDTGTYRVEVSYDDQGGPTPLRITSLPVEFAVK